MNNDESLKIVIKTKKQKVKSTLRHEYRFIYERYLQFFLGVYIRYHSKTSKTLEPGGFLIDIKHTGEVTLRHPKTGNIVINEKDYNFYCPFNTPQYTAMVNMREFELKLKKQEMNLQRRYQNLLKEKYL